MTKLIFMPWYSVPEIIKISGYEFHPFELKKSNASLVSIEHDAKIILSNYLEKPFTINEAKDGGDEKPISKASVVIDQNGKIEEDIEVLQYILSFSVLSRRKFLNEGYLCSDNFKIYVQNYKTPLVDAFAPFIGNRRKDGGAGNGWTPGLYREVKPLHIPSQPTYGIGTEFDLSVMNFLWNYYLSKKGTDDEKWSFHIFPSLFSYFEANTDGKLIQAECIYSHTAIERLLLGDGHGEENLVKASIVFFQENEINFEKSFSTTRDWKKIQKFKNPKFGSVESMFEGWLREFTRLRNSFAHGHHTTDIDLVWTINEHLILSSYLYPLLLNVMLSKFDPPLMLTNYEVSKIEFFEHLLAIDEGSFMKENQPESGTTNWGKVYEAARFGGIVDETLIHDFEYGDGTE